MSGACVDFGGRGPLLHLAHANGYPPGAYRAFAAALRPLGRVIAQTTRMLVPGTDPGALESWHDLAGDLIALLEAETADHGPAVGIGHSLGGVVTLYAAVSRPELFRAVALIEPVFLPPDVVERARDAGGLERLALVDTALRRRDRFADPAEALAHWRPKPVFAGLSDAVLADYVAAALREDPAAPSPAERFRLAYPREWEARVYATPPLDVWDFVTRLAVPTLAVRGPGTDTLAPEAWTHWRRLQPGARFVEVPGTGHLAPLERPEAVAAEVAAFVGRLDPADGVDERAARQAAGGR